MTVALLKSKSAKVVLVAAVYVLFLVFGTMFGTEISHGFNIQIWPHTEPLINRIVVLGILLYIVLTAIPFVPGIELGMALIVAFGVRIVPAVYCATLTALILSFLVGRLVPEYWIAAGFRWIGFSRAEKLALDYAEVPVLQRATLLLQKAPSGWLSWVLRYRLIALAILFNLPGSALLGGGGGIAMAAGISRLVSFPKFLLCAAIAVSPVPLFLLITAALRT
jgi:hypothetical protein